MSLSERVKRLRGRMPRKAPGARGIEKAARNLGCERLQALTITGIGPRAACDAIYERRDAEGQSPFALGAGQSFERHLTRDGARVLRELYREAGRFSGAIQVLDLAERFPGRGGIAERLRTTEALVRTRRAGEPAPEILLSARLSVDIPGLDGSIEPDALVAEPDGRYRVVEIKSYADRRGKTDPARIRGACRQAAVGVHALEAILGPGAAPPIADLILRRPGSFTPTLRPMRLSAELRSIEAFFGEVKNTLERVEARIPSGASLDQRSALDALPIRYRESCKEFCALASVCRDQAEACGDPGILGDGAREVLAPVRSIDRALELLHGLGEPPRTTEEAALKKRLQSAFERYGKAVGYGV